MISAPLLNKLNAEGGNAMTGNDETSRAGRVCQYIEPVLDCGCKFVTKNQSNRRDRWAA